jgi:hypothetical protein
MTFLPVVPGLAVLGVAVLGDTMYLFLIYVLAVAAPYFFQAAQVWYYAIPIVPPLAISAAFGAAWLSHQGINGLAVICFLGLVWLGVHMGQSYGRLWLRGLVSLNRYVWQPYGDSAAEKNLHLDEIAPPLRRLVKGRRTFIFGAWNQAYVLLESSYDTALVSAAPWLDNVAPGWQTVLNEQFLKDAPDFLLDTEGYLDAEAIKQDVGLSYARIGPPDPQFRLFMVNGPTALEKTHLGCRLFVTH